MFARIAPVLIVSAVALLSLSAQAQTYKLERAAHPRIARAIHELREVVRYLEAAPPRDFCGAKAAAVASSNQAIKDLQAALKYREAKDTIWGK